MGEIFLHGWKSSDNRPEFAPEREFYDSSTYIYADSYESGQICTWEVLGANVLK